MAEGTSPPSAPKPQSVNDTLCAPPDRPFPSPPSAPKPQSVNDTLCAPTDRPFPYWRVWKTADILESEGLSSPTYRTSAVCQRLTQQVATILKQWGHRWAGLDGWQGLLNKSGLRHEVEESIVAMTSLVEWMERQQQQQEQQLEPVTVVDVCCGKGIFSMLLSYTFQGDDERRRRVRKIVMLDKATSINWHHVESANGTAETDGRPRIETWGGCNLHDRDDMIDRLESLEAPLALVGIHLCKMLSPTCVGLVNALGPERCPFLCLAPCCLPRLVTSRSKKKKEKGSKKPKRDDASSSSASASAAAIIEVPLYELPDERRKRREAAERRLGARNRERRGPCYLCQSPSHNVHDCDRLPTEKSERLTVLSEAQRETVPCWRCGIVGHFKADCPSDQPSCTPTRVDPPSASVDVSGVLDADRPFEAYCGLLTSTLQRGQVRMMETGLTNDTAKHEGQEANWNRGRKSIYIVATR